MTSDHHYMLYSTGLYFMISTYFLVDRFLFKTNEKYRKLGEDKRLYVVSNLLKAVLLGAISPIASTILYQTMVLNQWNNNLIRNVGILYALPDSTSLVLVRKMQLTTKVHHIIVCLFNLVSMHNDYQQDNIIRCMIIYACLSCFAFIVNLLLGVRYLHNNQRIGVVMAKAALYIYMICCLINWTWHGKYVYTLVNKCDNTMCQVAIPSYCAMIMMLAWDDIKLNKWLYKESKIKHKVVKDKE